VGAIAAGRKFEMPRVSTSGPQASASGAEKLSLRGPQLFSVGPHAELTTAAVFADAAHIVEEIVLLKTRATAAAAADPTE
jgi:hypothetical protein